MTTYDATLAIAGITDDPVLTRALDAQIPLGLKLKAIAHLAHPTALKTLLSELR